MSRRIVKYVHSDQFLDYINQIPQVISRGSLVHELIKGYGLLEYLDVISPRPALDSELKQFHSSDYIEFLERVNQDFDSQDEIVIENGLGYDCEVANNLFELVRWIAGGTLTAARQLVEEDSCNVAINWGGGWHHARRDEARGFCYVNDIVLGIQTLKQRFKRILYIDLDLHHGDGVEEAYEASNSVFCVSFHLFESGFYPSSGSLESIGSGKGRGYTVNVPLRRGISDANYNYLTHRVLEAVRSKFLPQCVVVQCGGDGLVEDPHAALGLTLRGMASVIQQLLAWSLPLLLLGGGGYNLANMARCWTALTSLAVDRGDLHPDIPDHPNFLSFGPSYELHLSPATAKDHNTKEYLNHVLNTILENLEFHLPHSVN